MSRFCPFYCWFRSEIWALIEDCRSCELRECPNWCKEFVELQMDEVLGKVTRDVRDEWLDALNRGGFESARLEPASKELEKGLFLEEPLD